MTWFLRLFFYRRGSVVAIFNMTFTRDIADDLGDNVTNNLAVAVKSGNLGGLPVDPASLSITKVGEWVRLFTFDTSREGGACYYYYFFFEKQLNVENKC